jgi:hypothetical protein
MPAQGWFIKTKKKFQGIGCGAVCFIKTADLSLY